MDPFEDSANNLALSSGIAEVAEKILLSVSPKNVVRGASRGFMEDLQKIRADPLRAMDHLAKTWNKAINIVFTIFIHTKV